LLLLPWSPLFIRSSLFVHELRQLEPHEDESQSFIHQVRILSEKIVQWGSRTQKESQSFIHQVRILSGVILRDSELADEVAILYSSSQNSLPHRGSPCVVIFKSQSFIHQVRILSCMARRVDLSTTAPLRSQSFIHQVRILSSRLIALRNNSLSFVAILYSSSQNSLGKWS